MREVKYRAWVEREKVLVDVLSIDFKEKTVKLPIQTPVISDYWWDETTWNFEDVILMQYTGLKDKNGVEIYEGNIVNHLYHYYAGHGVVLEENEIIVIEDIAKLPFDGSSVECEIIGNIYENPEFLEGK